MKSGIFIGKKIFRTELIVRFLMEYFTGKRSSIELI
jgi:hypothetical protein